jgi:hypothetical protein
MESAINKFAVSLRFAFVMFFPLSLGSPTPCRPNRTLGPGLRKSRRCTAPGPRVRSISSSELPTPSVERRRLGVDQAIKPNAPPGSQRRWGVLNRSQGGRWRSSELHLPSYLHRRSDLQAGDSSVNLASGRVLPRQPAANTSGLSRRMDGRLPSRGRWTSSRILARRSVAVSS